MFHVSSLYITFRTNLNEQVPFRPSFQTSHCFPCLRCPIMWKVYSALLNRTECSNQILTHCPYDVPPLPPPSLSSPVSVRASLQTSSHPRGATVPLTLSQSPCFIPTSLGPRASFAMPGRTPSSLLTEAALWTRARQAPRKHGLELNYY